jgi:hypothetical protein
MTLGFAFANLSCSELALPVHRDLVMTPNLLDKTHNEMLYK